MNGVKKRIGFILASIHNGSATHLWTALAREVKKTSTAFFIFPGGRLDSKDDSEYLRNSIYRLANSCNLDGLISWGSSLGGAVSVEELNDFHYSLKPLPYVTIAHKMMGRPCVRFDAYTGMKSLVRHFIEVHGSRSIAFLRGPENHVSAADRFAAYQDALAEAGITLNPLLITDPFPWNEGESAIKQLCEARSLIAGSDFDTLIASSDLLALPAVQYLQTYGFAIPETVRVGGFNDSSESRLPSSPLSTVHMPYAELGVAAFGMLGSVENDCEQVLPATLVIRESCGCKSIRKFFEEPVSDFVSRTSGQDFSTLCAQIARLFHVDSFEKSIELVLLTLRQKKTEAFFCLLENSLADFFAQGKDTAVFFDAVLIIKSSSFFCSSYLQTIESRFFALVSRVQNYENAQRQYESEKIHSVLNSLKCALLTARSRSVLADLLAHYLPQIGITAAAVVLYETDDFSLSLGGFSEASKGVTRVFEHNHRFSAQQLVPDEMKGSFDSGIFMVQPLFMENQPLGALLCSAPLLDGSVFEELRSALSSALKGIFLFEEVSQAKQLAEAAEHSQTAFFANIGTDLCDPLVEIVNKIDQLRQAVSGGVTDPDLLLAQLVFLQSAVNDQLNKSNLLIDVTLSQVHELPLEKRLFSVAEMLESSSLFDEGYTDSVIKFPFLYGDPDRLLQALELICTEFKPVGTPSFDDNGVSFVFEAATELPSKVWKKNELRLAEHILLLQHGDLQKNGKNGIKGCVIVFPLPNLACLPPIKPDSRQEPVVFYADTASDDDWIRLYAQRTDSVLFRTPAMVFAKRLESKTFVEEMEKRLQNRKKHVFLFIGKKRPYPLWTEGAHVVCISDINDFEQTVERYAPALVILDSLDPLTIEKIRRNPKTVLTPVLLLPVHITDEEAVLGLGDSPRLVLCNRCVAESAEFAARVRSLVSGDEMLPPHTGALVKKAIVYLNKHADSQITRWKMADAVHVSEDYLTRIFHKETGLSPWEYLNRCRIFKACELLLHTGKTLYEIASETGFQDQAYFCRVFKKITGMPPGHYRDPKKQGAGGKKKVIIS